MGTLVLVTWGSPRNPLNLQGFPPTFCLAKAQEVKVNLCSGTQTVKKKKQTGILSLFYAIQNEKKNVAYSSTLRLAFLYMVRNTEQTTKTYTNTIYIETQNRYFDDNNLFIYNITIIIFKTIMSKYIMLCICGSHLSVYVSYIFGLWLWLRRKSLSTKSGGRWICILLWYTVRV